MKTLNPTSLLVMGLGIFLMAFFGSSINRSIAPTDTWASHLLLPGYSLGLITISASMFLGLTWRVRELESKIHKLENKTS